MEVFSPKAISAEAVKLAKATDFSQKYHECEVKINKTKAPVRCSEPRGVLGPKSS